MYTTSSPFVDGGAPYLSAAFFNGLTTGNPATLWVHPTLGADSNNGTTPGSPKATIAAALTALPAAGGVIQLAAATYPCTAFTLDVSKHTLRGVLGTKLDFSSLSGSGTAITLTGTASVLTQFSVQTPLENLEIIGPGSGTSSTGLYFNATTAWTGDVHQAPKNLNIHGFGYGLQFGSETYMLTFTNTVVWACNVGGWTPAAATNGGERITFVGGAFQNCVAKNFLAENPNGDVYFQSVSFDYPTSGQQLEVNNSQVFLDGCHVEDSSTNTSAMFLVTGAGFLRMSGGMIAQTSGLGARTGIIQNNADYNGAGAVFDGVRMSNVACTGGYFGTGTGRTVVRNTATDVTIIPPYCVSATMNLLADGDMEGTGVIDDWVITADTATITNRTTGTNISLAKSTVTAASGTQSLAAVKVGAASTNAQFSLPVAVPPGSKPLYRFQWAKPGSQTGTMFLSLYAARLRDNGTTVTVTNKVALKQVSVTLTASANGWTSFTADNPNSLPAWATHILFEVNLTSVGAGIFYVDAVQASTI